MQTQGKKHCLTIARAPRMMTAAAAAPHLRFPLSENSRVTPRAVQLLATLSWECIPSSTGSRCAAPPKQAEVLRWCASKAEGILDQRREKEEKSIRVARQSRVGEFWRVQWLGVVLAKRFLIPPQLRSEAFIPSLGMRLPVPSKKLNDTGRRFQMK